MAARIPLCVPYWDEREVLNLGAKYDKSFGFFVPADEFLDPYYYWLPLRYREPPEGAPILVPEMLPSTSWEDNVRTRVSPERWDKLRRYCYAAAGHRCEICGEKGKPYLEAHEQWSFHEAGDTSIQKLEKLLALCPTCHKAKHLGFAKRVGMLPDVLQHLMTINEWTMAQLRTELDTVHETWLRQSEKKWTVDVSWLETYRV